MTEGATDPTTSVAFQEYRGDPGMATAALEAKATAFKAAERLNAQTEASLLDQQARSAPQPAADSGASRAKLAELSADPAWRDAFFRGDVEARRTFSELNASIAAGSTVSDVLAGADASGAEYTMLAPGQLSARVTALEIQHLKSLGLNEATVRQIFEGGPVSAQEVAMATQVKAMRLSDSAFVQRFMSNEFSAKREMLLLNSIISAAGAA
jgi:hypothetical protein